MGRSLIHMQVRRKYPEVRISLLKALIVFIQYGSCQLCILAGGAHIVLISDLQDNLVEGFFLIAGTDFFVIVWDPPVCTGLLLIVAFQSFIEKLMVHGLDTLVAVVNISVGAASVYIFCPKFAAVVVDRAFTHLCANRSLHKISLPFTHRPQPGFCYSCQE